MPYTKKKKKSHSLNFVQLGFFLSQKSGARLIPGFFEFYPYADWKLGKFGMVMENKVFFRILNFTFFEWFFRNFRENWNKKKKIFLGILGPFESL